MLRCRELLHVDTHFRYQSARCDLVQTWNGSEPFDKIAERLTPFFDLLSEPGDLGIRRVPLFEQLGPLETVMSLEDFLDAVGDRCSLLREDGAVSIEVTQFPDRCRRHEAAFQQSVLQQAGDPLTIFGVRLPAGTRWTPEEKESPSRAHLSRQGRQPVVPEGVRGKLSIRLAAPRSRGLVRITAVESLAHSAQPHFHRRLCPPGHVQLPIFSQP
jgi:hypothetical protein